ncbi:MAG: hypothetical protein SVW51_16320 [Pseudomonadota bacterium]|nr:hypothetical protein [Pseudomonadota bacterium]
MSAVITTATPFTIQDVLVNALDVLGYEPTIVTIDNVSTFNHSNPLQVSDIITNRIDYYGHQYFRLVNDQWVLLHDSSEMNGRLVSKTSKQYQSVGLFLKELSAEYTKQYSIYLEYIAELEKQRIEAERKARVEKTRKRAIERAKAQGYVVKEKHINGKIQLVCSRTI